MALNTFKLKKMNLNEKRMTLKNYVKIDHNMLSVSCKVAMILLSFILD